MENAENIVPVAQYTRMEDTELYRQHVIHFFDTQLGHDIVTMSPDKKVKLFKMLSEYSDVLREVLHEGIPLIEHVLGNSWNMNGDVTQAHEMIRQYEAWKNAPKAEDEVQQS